MTSGIVTNPWQQIGAPPTTDMLPGSNGASFPIELGKDQLLALSGGLGGITNLAALRPWYDAFSDVMNSPLLIHYGSDSTAFGLWSDNVGTATDVAAAPLSAPSQLARLMNLSLGIPNTFSINTRDDRNAYSGGSISGSVGLAARTQSMTTGNTTTITVPACTAFDLIYYESNGSTVNGNVTPLTGSGTYNVDGAGAVAVTYADTVDTYKKMSVTGLANTAHTIVLAGTTANVFYPVQVNCHSGAGVMVSRCGVSGFTLASILGKAPTQNLQSVAGQARLLAAFAQGTPNLVILTTGQNECTNQNNAGFGPQTPTAWAEDIKLIAGVLAAINCPLLFLSEPDPNNSDAALKFKYRDYWAAARALAVPGSNIAHIAIGDYWGNFVAARTAGFVNDSSGVHPLRKGYGYIASLLTSILGRSPVYRGELVTGA